MRFTASSNLEDSHDALSSTVDCASTSTDDSVISTLVIATRHTKQCALDIVIKMYSNDYLYTVIFAVVTAECIIYTAALVYKGFLQRPLWPVVTALY